MIPKQIGWDDKTNWYWYISKQLDRMINIASKIVLTTTTSTTIISTTTSTTITPTITTTTTTVILSLSLTWDNISNVPVASASSVANWNTFFGFDDDPTLYTTQFTSVVVIGNTVNLIGGSNIKFKDYLFGDSANGANLLQVVDTGCVIECGEGIFSDYGSGDGCYNLTKVHLPNCTILNFASFGDCESLSDLNLPFSSYNSLPNDCFINCTLLTIIPFYSLNTIGDRCFRNCTTLTIVNLPILNTVGDICFNGCTSLISIYLPSCTNLGTTIGDNSVFYHISGNTITMTIPSALMTCNGGQPDGDIVYLQNNNTVMIIQV